MQNSNLDSAFIASALRAYKDYDADRLLLIDRVSDNENLYKSWYNQTLPTLNSSPHCETPLIFSSIENGVATFNENYPSINIIERSPNGENAAEILTKLVPIVLDRTNFKDIYKENVRRKLKFGTSIYIITCDEENEEINIREWDINDIRCDMHVKDVQDSKFLFVDACIDNEVLKVQFPDYARDFTGDAVITSVDKMQSYKVYNSSKIVDCYYKKLGKVHLIKFFNDKVIAHTEGMEGYENGLYDHGLYPVVFDTYYPEEESPFGFGMIDICKSSQLLLTKLDTAYTENILVNAKPRYLCKRNGGIDEAEFSDMTKNVVHYDGDTSALIPIPHYDLSANALSFRERLIDLLKEVAANRDFQQGQTSGGVTAASAIQVLVQSGEKRSRCMIDDSYNAFKKIVFMVIELIKQFYKTRSYYRVDEGAGQKSFFEFSNELLKDSTIAGTKNSTEFDIILTPQKENPYSREQYNNTVLTLMQSGLLAPDRYPDNSFVIKSMQFDGKDTLLEGYRERYEEFTKQAQEQQQAAMAQQQAQSQPQAMQAEPQQAQGFGDLVPVSIPNDSMMQGAEPAEAVNMNDLVGIPIGGMPQ